MNESQINGCLALILLMSLFLSCPASSQTKDQDSRESRGFSQRESSTGYTDSMPVFGGPTSSEGQLEEADRVLDPAFRFPVIDAFYQPWTDWKTNANKQRGVQISTHYSTMAQYLSDPVPDLYSQTSTVISIRATFGLIRKFMYRSDVVGVSATWGSPPGKTLKNQKTIEAFWRFQFSKGLAFTPSIQYLVDPALHPTKDKVWILGFRTRLAM